MTTEITKLTDGQPKRGTVLFDDQCRICVGFAREFAPLLQRRGFALSPLPEESKTEMHVRTADGRTFGGADAVVFVARHVWWAWPLVAISKLPGAMPMLRRAYRWIAEHRHCVGGVCQRKVGHESVG